MEYFGTLGPSCAEEKTLREMIQAGMTGLRINLSHGGLNSRREWIRAAQAAAREEGKALKLLIDLEGPELRIGQLPEILELKEGDEISLPSLGIPVLVLEKLEPGDEILLDDGRLLLSASRSGSDNGMPRCETGKVLRGGLLKSRKSLAVTGKTFQLPTLTKHDLGNLALAEELGVTGVMLPFVRGKEDLVCLREALAAAGCPSVRIYAKIENLAGVAHLDELIQESDEIVIARGDLGNSMPLWKLPAVQKMISAACREKGRDFMVVTQMLDSMHTRAVPTRAEVMDIFQAVLDGASSVMLTGETAGGKYPVEAMTYLVRTGREGEKARAAHGSR